MHFKNDEGEYDFAPAGDGVGKLVAAADDLRATPSRSCATTRTTARRPKLTIPSPSMVHYRGGNSAIRRDVYPDIEEFWTDLSTPTASSCAASTTLAAATCSSTTSASPTSTTRRSASTSRRSAATPTTSMSSTSRTSTGSCADKPADLAVTTHLCRGNNQSMWAAEGGYDFVAEALFGELDVDGYFLSSTTSGQARSSRCASCPKGQAGGAGARDDQARASSRTPTCSSAASSRRRPYVDLDQLCLSPQCGFSSTEEGNNLTIDEQKAKLELIVRVASEVWGA